MKTYIKIVLFGFLTWTIAFLISFVIFPLRSSDRGFFDSVMGLTVVALAVLFSAFYLRGLRSGFVGQGVRIGLIWPAVNLAIDLPLFLSPSPMQMSPATYLKEIGISYLAYPIVAMGFGYLLERAASESDRVAPAEKTVRNVLT